MQPIGSTVSLIILAASTSRQFKFQKRSQLCFSPASGGSTPWAAIRVFVHRIWKMPSTIFAREATLRD